MGKILAYVLSEDDGALLSECRVDVYRSSGPGGQSVNTTDSAVRLTHLPTGIVVTCQDERSQLRNKQKAVTRLRVRIEELQTVPEERRPTKPSRGAKEARLQGKRELSEKKQSRRMAPED
jgi:protein subunit release factor A